MYKLFIQKPGWRIQCSDHTTSWTVQGLIPGRISKMSRPALVPHPASHSVGTKSSFPQCKALGNEVDHSPPSSAMVKNEWSCTSTPPPPYALTAGPVQLNLYTCTYLYHLLVSGMLPIGNIYCIQTVLFLM